MVIISLVKVVLILSCLMTMVRVPVIHLVSVVAIYLAIPLYL